MELALLNVEASLQGCWAGHERCGARREDTMINLKAGTISVEVARSPKGQAKGTFQERGRALDRGSKTGLNASTIGKLDGKSLDPAREKSMQKPS